MNRVPEAWAQVVEGYDNAANLAATLEFMRARLGELAEELRLQELTA